MTKSLNTFSDQLKLGLIGVLAICLLLFTGYGFLHLPPLRSFIETVVSIVSGSKIWWCILGIGMLLNFILKKLRLQNGLSALISAPVIGFLLAFILLRQANEATVAIFSLRNFAIIGFVLIFLFIDSILISLSKSVESIFYKIGGIIVLLFFVVRFVFFEEYYFSQINNQELFVQIKPLIEGTILLIAIVFWLALASMYRKDPSPINSMVLLGYASIFTTLYFSVFINAINAGDCEAITLRCFLNLW